MRFREESPWRKEFFKDRFSLLLGLGITRFFRSPFVRFEVVGVMPELASILFDF